ncbi:MAG: hypothetical protein IPI43_23360 [Sandaracinaceae bacterium]|nr:hypothetical protein [Sandaracinaceae bacterium]
MSPPGGERRALPGRRAPVPAQVSFSVFGSPGEHRLTSLPLLFRAAHRHAVRAGGGARQQRRLAEASGLPSKPAAQKPKPAAPAGARASRSPRPPSACRPARPRTDAYLGKSRAEFPGLCIVKSQDYPWSQRIDKLLRGLTLGGQSAYVSTCTTVLGRTIYPPTSWDTRSDESRYITPRHEAVHPRQFRR